MSREMVTLCVPYVNDERRFLLHAVQAALEAHRALQQARTAVRDTYVGAAGDGMSREQERPQSSVGQEHTSSVREIIFGLL
jgi:hypothetical protein